VLRNVEFGAGGDVSPHALHLLVDVAASKVMMLLATKKLSARCHRIEWQHAPIKLMAISSQKQHDS
jgi:hypothetical protein